MSTVAIAKGGQSFKLSTRGKTVPALADDVAMLIRKAVHEYKKRNRLAEHNRK